VREPLNVLVYTRESSASYRLRLTDSEDVRYVFCASEDEISMWIEEADVILGSVHFPSRLLARARRLRWVQVTGAGVDAFLAQVSLPEDVLLTRADVSFGDQIAEYVIGHLLAWTQRIRQVHRLQDAKRWELLPVEFLRGRTIGVAGTGSIGRAVAECARCMGMQTVGFSRTTKDLAGFDACYGPKQLSEFLAGLDVFVLCLPLTPETRGLIGCREFAVMKSSALLVNVARGAIIDEQALIDALRTNALAGAILDVFATEPLPVSSPLWAMDNVTITSHHAGLNVPDEIIAFFLENLARFRSGGPLRGLIDPKQGY